MHYKTCIYLLAYFLTFNKLFASISTSVVVELTDEDFEERLLDYEHALVVFYAPNCVHCKTFMPEFSIAADELIRNEPPVHSLKVDCLGGGKEICKQEDISGLPTIKMYKRGTLFDEYDGARSAPELINYMKSLVGIASVDLNEIGAFGFDEGHQDVTVIAFLRTTGELRDNYFGLPPQLSKDIRFGHFTVEADAAMANRIKLIRPDYMTNKFEPSEYVYEGDDGHDLLEFILKHRHGIVGLRKPKNIDDFGAPLVIAYYPIDIVLKRKMFVYWRNRILKVARNYARYLNFAVSPIDDFHTEFTKFGIDVSINNKQKLVVFAILEDNTKYLMHNEFSVETFDDFIKSLIDKTAEPHFKSQPIPIDKPVGEFITTAVARNFKQVVIESERDVLLEFYAPWCTHCRQLAGTLNELAQIMIEEDVSIVKMDATANEIPADLHVTGYPTIYWLPMTAKYSPVTYEGGSSLQNFIDFIATHATHELKNYDRRGRSKKIQVNKVEL